MVEVLAATLLLISASFAAFQRLFVKTSKNRYAFLFGINAVSVIVGLLCVGFVPLLPFSVWPFLLLSGVFYTLAMVFLVRGYDSHDFSIVTPSQGAVKAVVISLLAVLLLGEQLSVVNAIAVLLLILGFAIQIPWKYSVVADHFSSLKFALLIGGFSAAQYVTDVYAIRQVAEPFTYIVWNLFIGVPVMVYSVCKTGPGLMRALTEDSRSVLLGAFLDLVGYALVLFVAYHLALLYIVPIINLDIFIAALLGIVLLRERYPMRRLVGASCLAASALVVGFFS